MEPSWPFPNSYFVSTNIKPCSRATHCNMKEIVKLVSVADIYYLDNKLIRSVSKVNYDHSHKHTPLSTLAIYLFGLISSMHTQNSCYCPGIRTPNTTFKLEIKAYDTNFWAHMFDKEPVKIETKGRKKKIKDRRNWSKEFAHACSTNFSSL